jgi:Lrp/AsnC family transcriptional regulator, leucine-responsive regulatory protein
MDTKATGPNASPVLDRIDEAIIDVLRHQGRITYEKLSSLVHLTPRPCLERVRKLERRGVIRGYGAIIDVQMVSPGLSLLVLVALSNQSGRSAQKAFEACVKACPQVFECQLISGPFDYSLRMRCRDMEHYRVLTETWLNNDELQIDKLVAHPELGITLGNIGAMYLEERRFTDAEPYLQRALTITEREYGRAHPYVAEELVNLGVLFYLQGRYDEARGGGPRRPGRGGGAGGGG